METFDAAIIGAGPAGAAAAISLAGKGYRVALIDKEKFPRGKLCGDFINPVNWPILRELDVENDLLSSEHGKVRAFRITACSGERGGVAQVIQTGSSVHRGAGGGRPRCSADGTAGPTRVFW